MPKNDSHQNQFAYQAMPILFHNSSRQFMILLKKDGMKFLEFWWDQTAKDVEEEDRIPADGLRYEIRDYNEDKKIVLITLPHPKKVSEAYFLAMLTPPSRRYWLPWKNLARVFALQKGKSEHGQVLTRLVELTPRGIQRDMGPGSQPALLDFYAMVCDRLK